MSPFVMPKKNSSKPAILTTPPARWKHQEATRRFFRNVPEGFDLSDPGTGKTRASLDVYADRTSPKRLLILCPKTLMTSAWASDIEAYHPEISYSLAYAERREEAFQMKTDAVIMNLDGVKWLAKEGRGFIKQFDHLVIDECTAFKHHTSQRSRAAAFIARFFKARYGLTGTPTPISVVEMWHQAMIIDRGKRLGDNFFRFRNIMQWSEQIGPSAEHRAWHDKPGAAQALFELLNDITIRHAFEDVMTHVPPNHRDQKRFRPNAKLMKLYNELAAKAIVQLGNREVVGVHAAALRSKLLQLASGAVYSVPEDDESPYVMVDRQRYELIADLIEERDHSVVFFNWRHQRIELAKELDRRKIPYAIIDGSVPVKRRDEIVKRYQNGDFQTILLHPRTGAHGLTLTRGTTTILSSPIYEADMLKQAIHRIYRGDQREVTNTLMVIADGTVEDLVYERLDDRYGRMSDLLSLLESKQ